MSIYEIGEWSISIALQVNGFQFNAQVDKGFVAQVADVTNGRSAPMNEEQRSEAQKTVVGEFSDVKHVRGILSMGRLGFNLIISSEVFDFMFCFSFVSVMKLHIWVCN